MQKLFAEGMEKSGDLRIVRTASSGHQVQSTLVTVKQFVVDHPGMSGSCKVGESRQPTPYTNAFNLAAEILGGYIISI